MNRVMTLPQLRRDQWEIAQHPAKRKYICCGRRWGKSVLGGVLAATVLRGHGAVAWISPTYKNSRPLWRWISGVCRPLPQYFRVNEAERMITTNLGGFMGLYSADNIDSIRGEKFHLAIVDEGARVSQEAVQEAIEPTLADFDGDELIITTPKGINWFSEAWDDAKTKMNGDVAAWRRTSFDNPLPGIKKAYLAAKAMLPDNVFAQEWDGIPSSAGGAVFQREWFNPRYTNVSTVGRYVSWDTAMKEKELNDFSAYTVGDMGIDYRLRTREVGADRLTFPRLLESIVEVATRWNYDGKLNAIVIEDKGSGTSALQSLRANAPDWLRPLLVEFQPKGDKVARANHSAIWCKTGCVQLPEIGSVDWLYDFERQLFSFPDVLHDDKVDSFTQMIIYLENILEAGLNARSGGQA